MSNQQFCNNLVHYRQAAKMTQDDLASKLGVTPQAVSKWERGIGYPDLEITCAIAEFLHISLDQLLLEKAMITESGKRIDSDKVMSIILSDPILFQAGEAFIPHMLLENEKHFNGIQKIREELAKEYGYLLPVVRMKDNTELEDNQYQICIYDKVALDCKVECLDEFTFKEVYEVVKRVAIEQYDCIINKQIVKNLLDNIAFQYPAVIQNLIPDKVSYSMVQQILVVIIKQGKSIRNLIKIIEWIEEGIMVGLTVEKIGIDIAKRI